MTYENHKYLLMNSRLRPFPCYWYCNDILWWCNQLLITAILVLLMSCLLLMISQSNCTCIYWIISLVAFINGNFIGVIRSEMERVIFLYTNFVCCKSYFSCFSGDMVSVWSFSTMHWKCYITLCLYWHEYYLRHDMPFSVLR